MSFYGPTPEWTGKLSVRDFPSISTHLQWEDGSKCVFQYAFYRYENDRLVVYSEHCGYHSFHKSVLVLGGKDKTKFDDPKDWHEQCGDE